MPEQIYIIIAVSALVGFFLLWRGMLNIFRDRLHRFRGLVQTLFAFVSFTVASVLSLLLISLSVYHPFKQDKQIATLSFEALHEPQRYIATLDLADDLERRFEIRGDQWQIDARILKWNGFASEQLGLKPVYQVERFQGRYDDADQEAYGEKVVNDLSKQKAIDLWSLAKRHKQYLPFVDAEYGSATYLPIRTDVSYEVLLSTTGLYAKEIE